MSFLKYLGFLAIGGLVVLLGSFALPEGSAQTTLAVLAALAIIPAVFYLVLPTVWHWKSRYRGAHSDLWGALLILETSGWFKIVYLFRHLLPDLHSTGRYRTGGLSAGPGR